MAGNASAAKAAPHISAFMSLVISFFLQVVVSRYH
jgi:hypothetical protein